MTKIIPWSFSSWSHYQTCPRQFYELRIAKNFKTEKSDGILWGEQAHTALENKAKYGTQLPTSMKRMEPIADKILAAPGHNYAEIELACDVNMQPVGFWDDNAYARGKGDLVKVNGTKCLSIDWKTGKVKSNSLQLDLMAALVFAKFPDVQEQSTCFMWFQAPSKPTIARYKREDVPRLMAQFEDGLKDMLWSEQNNVWPEKPSGLCRPNRSGTYPGCPVVTCPHNFYYKGKK